MTSEPMITSIKLVYSNQLFDIYIATNNTQPDASTCIRQSYVYFKGEFYSMTTTGIFPCSRAQTEFLLSVMTRFGKF
ncbi:hypothetical protein GCM10009347_37170 [Shewanella algicola]|jgi:hypothetical protein|uniref:Uncharacterized protein n=1 Tax=Shewanella algicola TaxID=640633 RepID=A0A9X1Z6W2_9GAMM|nr:hypothetical protein [Shewanella algicola]MCL1107431.1 hypothetical protein [Shewanella algicola]GGP68373.1 hypothetical protein GCM10009347_37170 [Shewanella algicola]